MNKPELLAPVGSMKSLYGVINAGADAVYLAGNRFGARAYADNFSDEELIEVIKISHLFGIKVYLTVNTLIKDTEIEDLIIFLRPLVDVCLDGVIVQDLGVIYRINKEYPKLNIHLSTQLSVTDAGSINLLKKYNVTRVVPARELSIEEIRHLKEEADIEIEAFIHGAMCYSYSGRCLFSSMLGTRSGNRGRCAQPCRLPYKTMTGDEAYILSMKDMCTIGIIPELMSDGIDSFKIEGRMKKPVYAAGVTSIYRKYIDAFSDDSNVKILSDDMDILRKLYIRSEISEGYYHKSNGKDMISIKSPSYSGADDDIIAFIEDKYVNSIPKLGIRAEVIFETGKAFVLRYLYKNIFAEIVGDIVEEAKKAPIDADSLKSRISKLGDTYFEITDCKVQMSDNAFLPIKAINEARRNCLNILLEKIIVENTNSCRSLY